MSLAWRPQYLVHKWSIVPSLPHFGGAAAPCGWASLLVFRSPTSRSAKCLYQFFGFHSYQGRPSEWAYRSLPRWQSQLQGSFGDGHFVWSTSAAPGALRAQERPFCDRCLPFVGISTLGVLALLCRWGYLRREVGGVADNKQKLAARSLLEALTSAALGAVAQTCIRIVVVRKWACVWPRKVCEDDPAAPFVDIVLERGPEGLAVRFDAVRALSEVSPRGSVASPWMKQLMGAD